MNRKKLLALFGLKWNPFTPDIPTEALLPTKKIEYFAWRVEQLVMDGGFALITGDPGTGKSVALRLLSDRLNRMRDVIVGVVERPQSAVGDFYREMGDIFGLKLVPHNRWGGFRLLRERWRAHIEATSVRPVLLIDEAQQMETKVLSELRLLSSALFDSNVILTVVLCGDARLVEKFRQDELLPLGSRIRTRLTMEYASRDDLIALLKHAIEKAGSASLLSPELIDVLADHSAGNYRVLMTMAGELLAAATAKESPRLDEKLFLEVFGSVGGTAGAGGAIRRGGVGERAVAAVAATAGTATRTGSRHS